MINNLNKICLTPNIEIAAPSCNIHDFNDNDSFTDPDNKRDCIIGDGWCPIGHYEEGTEFTDSFDGQQHTISNQFVNRSFSHGSKKE